MILSPLAISPLEKNNPVPLVTLKFSPLSCTNPFTKTKISSAVDIDLVISKPLTTPLPVNLLVK